MSILFMYRGRTSKEIGKETLPFPPNWGATIRFLTHMMKILLIICGFGKHMAIYNCLLILSKKMSVQHQFLLMKATYAHRVYKWIITFFYFYILKKTKKNIHQQYKIILSFHPITNHYIH